MTAGRATGDHNLLRINTKFIGVLADISNGGSSVLHAFKNGDA